MLGAWCALAVALTPCGAAAEQPADLRFVTPPLVVYDPEWRSVDVWVRLNRPLRHNIGHPAQYAGQDASLEITDTVHDVVGVYRNHLFPTCYGESLSLMRSRAPLVAGEPIEVTLWLRENHQLTATVPAVVREEDIPPQTELACPESRRSRPCTGSVRARYVGFISIVSATGTTCRTARAVLRSIGRRATAGGRCYEDLCAGKHRSTNGFRCKAGLSGEAAWDIVCRRGKREVRGYTAE